jgi:hypothetical protein
MVITSAEYTRIEKNIRIITEWRRMFPARSFNFAISLINNVERPASEMKVRRKIRVYT